MNRQYIGARYVPTFADPIEWDNLRNYEPLTIVTHNNNSYTSKKDVPVGTDINNTEYWALTGNYNAQALTNMLNIKELKTLVNKLKLDERKLSYNTMNIKNSVSILTNYYEECICYNPLANCFVLGVRDLSDNTSKLCIINNDFTLNRIINLEYHIISEISYDNNNKNIIACFTGSSPTIRKIDPLTYTDLGEFDKLDGNEECQYFNSIKKYITASYNGSMVYFNIYNTDRSFYKSISVDCGIQLDGFNQFWVYDNCIYVNTIGYWIKISIEYENVIDMEYAKSTYELEGMTEYNDKMVGAAHFFSGDNLTIFIEYDGTESYNSLGSGKTNIISDYNGNLNNLRNPGFYECSENCENKPTTVQTKFMLFILSNRKYPFFSKDNFGTQYCVNEGAIFYRTFSNKTFSKWARIGKGINLNNKVTPGDNITLNASSIFVENDMATLNVSITKDTNFDGGEVILKNVPDYYVTGSIKNNCVIPVMCYRNTNSELMWKFHSAYTFYDEVTNQTNIKLNVGMEAGTYVFNATYPTNMQV